MNQYVCLEFTTAKKAIDKDDDFERISLIGRLWVLLLICCFWVLDEVLDKVTTWYIEYDTKENYTSRKIGTGNNGNAILKAPYRNNCGLWTDEDMPLSWYDRYLSKVCSSTKFEELWGSLVANGDYENDK